VLIKLLGAWVLMALSVAIHAGGLSWALRWLRRRGATPALFWQWTWLFVHIAGSVIVLHLLEITAWAVYYLWGGAMADLPAALYFSAVTYTTTGYGDIVLPQDWRLVGAVEALTGILMCGWSTGFFFAVVTRMFDAGNRANA